MDGELLATCISCGGACDVQTVPGGGVSLRAAVKGYCTAVIAVAHGMYLCSAVLAGGVAQGVSLESRQPLTLDPKQRPRPCRPRPCTSRPCRPHTAVCPASQQSAPAIQTLLI